MSSNYSERGTAVKTALDHSWAWFTLHATQRLQSVNFYLISVAFLSAAFVTAAKEHMHALAGGIATLAVCISIFFYRMERRIRSLIHASEDALVPLQAELAKTLEIDAIRIVAIVEREKRGEWKYSKVFRYLYFTTGTAFVFGLLYVVWSAATNVPAAKEFQVVVQAIVGAFFMLAGYELLASSSGDTSDEQFLACSKWTVLVIASISIVAGIVVLVHLVFFRL